MVEEVTVSSELIERLTARIEALEKKLDEKDSKDSKDTKDKEKKSKEKSTAKKITDSISDITDDIIKESGKMAGSMIDATAEAMKEGANALSSLSDETNKEKLGTIPAAIVGIMRKTMDIQKKALDKFEDSYNKYDD